jgi:hypothetical protein
MAELHKKMRDFGGVDFVVVDGKMKSVTDKTDTLNMIRGVKIEEPMGSNIVPCIKEMEVLSTFKEILNCIKIMKVLP